MINQIVIILIAYLIGSISFGIVISRLFQLSDPRTVGSRNTGATNVLRSGNKFAAILTLLGDVLKGTLVVGIAMQMNLAQYEVACISLSVLIGHIFPIYYKFKGGKGVATALGILLALNGLLALITLGIWVIIFIIWRYSSLSAILASLFSPFIAFYILNESVVILITCILIAILIIYRHQSNIKNIIQGIEPRFK
jgi:glycerol-3-phosphate acyltransferase PlsY